MKNLNDAEKLYAKAATSYANRKFLYIFKGTGETYTVINYDAINCELNTFLSLFDVWGNRGGFHKISEDNNHSEVWFEVDKEFYDLVMNSKTFRGAIKRLGVDIVDEFPFSEITSTINEKEPPAKPGYDWKARWEFFEDSVDVEDEDD